MKKIACFNITIFKLKPLHTFFHCDFLKLIQLLYVLIHILKQVHGLVQEVFFWPQNYCLKKTCN